MNTIENNILIAEFLGWEQFGNVGLYDTTFHNDKGSLKWLTKDMKFHKDWNWLMEVVEKIESLNYSIEINKQEENDYQCLVVQKDIKVQTFSKIKIEAVYNACGEFIKWYNKNKTN